MNAGVNITVDANAVHPEQFHENDPRHLTNITKKIGLLNIQAAADTKYDPHPPTRVDATTGKTFEEPFIMELPPSDQKMVDEFFFMIGGFALIIIVIVFVVLLDPKFRNQIRKVPYGYYYVVGTLFVSILTLIVVKIGREKNEILMWYPPLRLGNFI
jgi:hypothetical protein